MIKIKNSKNIYLIEKYCFLIIYNYVKKTFSKLLIDFEKCVLFDQRTLLCL